MVLEPNRNRGQSGQTLDEPSRLTGVQEARHRSPASHASELVGALAKNEHRPDPDARFPDARFSDVRAWPVSVTVVPVVPRRFRSRGRPLDGFLRTSFPAPLRRSAVRKQLRYGPAGSFCGARLALIGRRRRVIEARSSAASTECDQRRPSYRVSHTSGVDFSPNFSSRNARRSSANFLRLVAERPRHLQVLFPWEPSRPLSDSLTVTH